MNLLKRYKWFLLFIGMNVLLYFYSQEIGLQAFNNTSSNFIEMLKVLPPIFILIGLFDVWVPRETLVKYMGENSGIKGVGLAFFLGSFTAGPLYASFPVATILLKKGSKFSNVMVFIGAWSSTKLPLLLFESTNLGFYFTGLRFLLNIIGIIGMAYLIERLTGEQEKNKIYALAKNTA